jgi:hypothetical protein
LIDSAVAQAAETASADLGEPVGCASDSVLDDTEIPRLSASAMIKNSSSAEKVLLSSAASLRPAAYVSLSRVIVVCFFMP